MGGRSKTHNHDMRLRITEPRHRASPVLLVGEGGTLLSRNLLAPRHQPWTAAARDNLVRQDDKCFRAAH